MSSSFEPLLKQRTIILNTFDEPTPKKNKKSTFLILIFTILLLIIGYIFYNYNKHLDKRSTIVQRITDDNGYSADAMADLITDLPNLIGDYDFLTFSGYLKATNNRLLHYWFVEATESPETKPLFLWTNGGPGCSGLVGFLTEQGPFWVYPDLKLRANDYSWNKEVNMLFVEQPYGIGFSVPTNGDSVAGDTESATDIDALLRSFMIKFPKYASSDLYISSESYGGHYMPLTALTILQNNENSNAPLNFKGFMVGNPYTDYYENKMGFVAALYGHGIIKSSLFNKWMTNCYGNTKALASVYCEVLYIEAYLEGYDLDAYALDYTNCPMDEVLTEQAEEYESKSTGTSPSSLMHARVKQSVDSLLNTYEQNEKELVEYNMDKEKLSSAQEKINSVLTKKATVSKDYSVDEAGNGTIWIACATYFAERYLNLEEVQTALHVTSTGWSTCNWEVFEKWPEKDWHNGMEKVYHTLVNDYDIKMLVYSGDDDSVCGLQGTMYWLSRMGWLEDTEKKWEAWTLDDQLSGYYTRYLTTEEETAIHFHTVRSAGHMVPQTQPRRALELLRKFLNDMD